MIPVTGLILGLRSLKHKLHDQCHTQPQRETRQQPRSEWWEIREEKR